MTTIIGFLRRHRRRVLVCVLIYLAFLALVLVLAGGPQAGGFRYQIF